MEWIVWTRVGWRARQRFACVCTIPRRLRCPSPRRNSRSLASGRDDPKVEFNTTQRKFYLKVTWDGSADHHSASITYLLPQCNTSPARRTQEAKSETQLDLTFYVCFDPTFLCRIKLTLEGFEEEDEDEEEVELSHSSWDKMTTTLEISMISANGYKSRHSQPECGYALEPSQWTEYSIHTMHPDNLELTFEFFEVKSWEYCLW